jgi:hypothetical protein
MKHLDAVPRLDLVGTCLVAVLCSPVQAQTNTRIQQLMQQDSADRANSRGRPWDPKVTERDRQRAAAVREELKAGRLKDAKDYYAAALIMQHGEQPDDYRLANSLSWIAFSMAEDPESVPAREAAWLYSASWDRLLLSLGRKQWFGTQRIRDPLTFGPGDHYPIEDGAAAPRDKERFSGPRYAY